jgi:hypothetical protein
MGSGFIAPAEDPCLWDVRGEKILEPIDVILCRPALVSFPIEAMNRDDAMIRQQSSMVATSWLAHSKVGSTPSANFLRP